MNKNSNATVLLLKARLKNFEELLAAAVPLLKVEKENVLTRQKKKQLIYNIEKTIKTGKNE